ncbi:MAG: hypothetical protein IPN34_15485 [Planctomycetes bacterium]|nr:hypothetical protein [Planctomycetota bacterium]
MLARPALLLLLCAIAPSVHGQELQRFDIVHFGLPAGWTRADESGAAVLQSPDGKATIRLAKSAPYAGNLKAVAEAKLAEARQRAEFFQHAGRTGNTHATSGGEWQAFFVQYASEGRAVFDWTLCVGAGKRYVMASLLTGSADDYGVYAKVFGPWCDALQLTTVEVLEKGSPRLTRFTLDETIDFVEWLIHSPLTAQQRGTIETEVRSYWKAKNQAEIDGITELLKVRSELAKVKPEERELVRQALLEEGLNQWREDKESPVCRMLLEVHAAANQPIAPGEPPLVRQAVDAYAEYLYFAAGKAADIDVQVSAETKQKLAEEVAKGYAKMPQDRRELIASMPMTWAGLRIAWPGLDEAQKSRLLAAWKEDDQMKKLSIQLSSLSMQNLLSNQARLQAQQMHFQMMSNIMQSNFDTMRIIASNMGGNTRYEYRW